MLLALLLLTPTSNILYNAIAPLSSSAQLPAAWSSCWLFLSDLLLLFSASCLYPYTRDLLLLSPVISDAQYNSFVSSRLPRMAGVVGLLGLLAVLIAAAVSGSTTVLLVYLCAVLGYVALFCVGWFWQFYGLAARDVKAVRRISVATVPAKLASSPAPVQRVDNSWMATTDSGRGGTRTAHAPSISGASTAPQSSLSNSQSISPLTMERQQAASRARGESHVSLHFQQPRRAHPGHTCRPVLSLHLHLALPCSQCGSEQSAVRAARVDGGGCGGRLQAGQDIRS